MNLISLFASLGAVEGGASEVPGTMSVLAFELPRAITPAIAGLTVGALASVFGFIVVFLIVGRDSRKSRRGYMRADQVVFIPPYGTMPRETPLPPHAFAIPLPSGRALPFVPSTSLSARAFAKMGYEFDAEDERDAPGDAPDRFVPIEVAMLDEDDRLDPPAVLISPVVVLSSTTPVNGMRSAEKTAPHPLAVINASSSVMKAAPVADLSFDDSPTEIGATYFDETPQPRRRTDPPKIRPIAPKGPRFPDATPMLPRVTPPRMRSVRSA